MKPKLMYTLIVIFVLLFPLCGQAGTRDDCIAKCKEAVEFIKTHGLDAAIKELSNDQGRFVWNDGASYVFLMSMQARQLAHPHRPDLLKHETLIHITDTNGKPFFQDFVKNAQKGKGWTNYVWPVPGKDVTKPKYTFIYRVPDADYFVGAGFYVMSPGVFY